MDTRDSILDADLRILVAEQVNEFINKKDLFTAYDVTLALQEEHSDLEIRHARIRTEVDSLFVGGDMDVSYNRISQTMKNGRDAFVYHRFDVDPSLHHAVDRTPNSNDDVDDSAVDDDSTVISTVIPLVSEIVEVTKESRIAVPQSLLRANNMNVGDIVYVSLNDDTDKVFVHGGYKIQDAKFCINTDGRLRLGATALSNKFGKNYSQYRATLNGDVIEITPVISA